MKRLSKRRSTVDSSKLKVNCGEKNPRTGLRPMRGTKVDDTGSEMRLWEKRAGDTGGLGNPEDVFGSVFVAVFRIRGGLALDGGVALLEGVGSVFEEDEAEDDMLGVGGGHVAAELVAGLHGALLH